MKNYLGRIEWEMLQNKLNFPLDISEYLPTGNNATCTVYRDEEYKISADVEIIGVDYSAVQRQRQEKGNGLTGVPVEPFELYGGQFYRYTLPQVVEGSNTLTFSPTSSSSIYKTELFPLAGIEMTVDMQYDLGWVSEWYINGPRHPFVFTSVTEREYNETFLRKLHALPDGGLSQYFTGNAVFGGGGRDHSLIQSEVVSFIIGDVPEPFGPAWSKNFFISYFPQLGSIPDKGSREAISEIVGFVLGRHLLRVGGSTYDRLGQQMEQDAVSPWGENIKATCSKLDFSPVYKGQYDELGIINDALSKLAPEYLKLRNTLLLNEALWRYWIANGTPLGTNLPILSSALEGLMNAWFNSTKTESRGQYVEYEKYQTLIAEGKEKISQALEGIPARDIIIRKIEGTNQMGTNEKFLAFFSEIGLQIGKVEKVAINARNKMAHGHQNTNDWQYVNVVTREYQTLFHRVFLKLLGYTGQYVDYSTYGFPKRDLSEPLGGPLGNGVLRKGLLKQA